MGYNGLSKNVRKRTTPFNTTDAQESAKDAASRQSSSEARDLPLEWDDDVQDQISALLDQTMEGSDDEVLDLAAIRRALAEQRQQPEPEGAGETTGPDPDAPADDSEAAEHRLDSLVKPFTNGQAAHGSESPVSDPSGSEDAKDRDVEARRSAEAATPAPSPGASGTPSDMAQTAFMQLLLKDTVVMALLQQGAVTFPQAMQVVREQQSQPDLPLWRFLVDIPGVKRAVIFKEAATAQGIGPIPVDLWPPDPDALRALVGSLPENLYARLEALNVIPLLERRNGTASRLVMATHDPTNRTLNAVLDALPTPPELYYGSEEAIAETLSQVLGAAATDTDAPAAAEEEEFLDLQWEPFENEEALEDDPEPPVAHEPAAATPPEPEPEPEPPATDEVNGVAWKPLAEYETLSLDDLDFDDPSLDDAPTPGVAAEETKATPTGRPVPGTEIPAEPSAEADGGGDQARAALPLADKPVAKVPEPSPADKPAVPPPADKPAAKVPELEDIPDVDLEKIKSKDRVVAMLLRKGIVTAQEIKRALNKQKNDQIKEPLWRIITLVDGANRTAIFAEAANVYAFKTAEMGDGKPDPEFARSVMNTFDDQLRDTLLKLRVVPFEVDLDHQTGAIKVVFITHDPTRPEVHRTMQKLKLERFELRYAPENVVTGLILEAFPKKNEFLERMGEHDAFDLGMSYDDQSNELIDEDALEAEISRSKLINLFEATLVEAVRQGASDVHIWPNANRQVEIHFRVDGRLQRWHVEDKVHPEALIAVIKDNAMNVDRFERDAAQDGFIQRWIDDALIRFRVSVLPIANVAQDVRSESIVIRVLDDRKVVKDLRQLGLHELALQRFRKAISQPHGMVILTGPTGSGKTTTLYASLHEVISPEVNVLTVEDPVEYILPGVRQIKLNHKLGLEGALRSILRHDPDIVMVGEMRDRDTAELAIKLANTGHLTFSTLHTNDAASAVTRLYKMGIEPFLIAYAINLVVAQRLIRRLCTQCKRPDPDPDPVLLKNLGFDEDEIANMKFYLPGEDEHCPKCKGNGFKGRRAVSEALYFSREIRHMIADSKGNLDEIAIKDLAMKQGMMTLQDSAREVVKQGDTSVLEMLRVISSED